jgi:hypothetical protein
MVLLNTTSEMVFRGVELLRSQWAVFEWIFHFAFSDD